jgi:hypothetical protein
MMGCQGLAKYAASVPAFRSNLFSFLKKDFNFNQAAFQQQ